MNDAWDPIEDLEPLDDHSLGLLTAYRGGTGPSEDAEARMLAGLRTRIATESSADAPATAVPLETAATPNEQGVSSNARTFAIAAVAFAAGVALTVSLSRPNAPQDPRAGSNGDAEQVVRHDATGLPGRARSESFFPQGGGASSDLSVPRGVEPLSERSWPLSIVDLAKPQSITRAITEVEPVEGTLPLIVEPTRPDEADDGTSPGSARRHSDDGARDSDRIEGATASRGPLRGLPDPAAAGRGTTIQGPWAPSVSGTPAGVGIGSAARNPAIGGPAPTAPNSGGGGSSDSRPDEPPPADEPPPPDEPTEDEPEDERPLEEVCTEELDACLADADAFCDFSHPGCESIEEFCYMRSMNCVGQDGGTPYPEHPPEYPPDEPEPDDCETDYSLCVIEAEGACVLGKLGPEECEQGFGQCDEQLDMCYGGPPPEPW